MLHTVEAGAGRIHPTGKDPLGGLVGTMILDLEEGGGFRRFAGGGGITITRRDGKRGEMHRLSDGRGNVRGLSGDLVQASQHENGARRRCERWWRHLRRTGLRCRRLSGCMRGRRCGGFGLGDNDGCAGGDQPPAQQQQGTEAPHHGPGGNCCGCCGLGC